jgi:Family of unknown function (DUF5681)
MKTGRARTQFKPGQSGNPGGRPKTAKLAELIRQFLDEETGGKTRLRQILEWLHKHKPEVLLHYAYGKPLSGEQIEVREKTTVAGLPEEYLEALREHAKTL